MAKAAVAEASALSQAMRILLLSQFFDPEPTFKGLAFANELVRRGHHVEVLTGFPNYPGGRLYPGYSVALWRREIMQGISILRTALYPSHNKSAIRRIMNYASFAISAATLGPAGITKPDVVYAYHPPTTIALPATVFRLLRRVPVVADIQDLWPDTVIETGMMKNAFAISLLNQCCRLAFRQMDRVVVQSPGFKRTLIDRGIPASKIDHIYNWCDEASMDMRPRDERIMEAYGLAGRFNVLFAGTMGTQQGLASVLVAARLCVADLPRVQFVFVGGGTERESLEHKVKQMGLSNVVFLPRQRPEDMGPLLAAADVLLVHLRDLPLFSITIPSKTSAYLAAGRPILMAVRGDAADLIRQSGSGLFCEPENPAALVSTIRQFATMQEGERNVMGQSGCRFYKQKLSLHAGVEEFEAVFAKAVASKGAANHSR
jgi:colanic acid biosynthesis glycosyl transferase WcaI